MTPLDPDAASQGRDASAILVTGSSGVVGRRVVRELRSLGRWVCEFRGDIASEEAASRFLEDETAPIGACINLAAAVEVARVVEDPLRAYRTNAIGAGVLIDAIARRHDDPYVLHCSTSHVYRSQSTPLGESSTLDPISAYGRTKLAGEFIARDTADQRGVRLGIARVFSLWAEDQTGSFLYPSLRAKFSEALPGDTIRVSGGNNVRDFLHADDVARILVKLAIRGVTGVVNVGSGVGTTVSEFAGRHAPSGVSVEAEDVSDPSSFVADTQRLSGLLDG